jgi:thiol:disulfide interchange protein DsbD
MRAARALAPALLVAGAVPAGSARAQEPSVRVAAVAEFSVVGPHERFRVAVRLVIPEGWHLGWVNPGGTGLPTTLAWSAQGVSADGPVEWPYPERDTAGGTVSHVYRAEVVVVTPFRVAPGRARSRIDFTGTLTWGLCAAVCLPQQRSVFASVTVGPAHGAHSPGWGPVEVASRLFPARPAAASAQLAERGDSLVLTLSGVRGLEGPVMFFPVETGRLAVLARARKARGGVAIVLPSGLLPDEGPRRLVGVLVPRSVSAAPALQVDASLRER